MTREISVETTETIVIRRASLGFSMTCSLCGPRAEMLSVEEAAFAIRLSPRAIYSWIEAGQLHFCEPEKGVLRVCINSLSRLLEQGVGLQDNSDGIGE